MKILENSTLDRSKIEDTFKDFCKDFKFRLAVTQEEKERVYDLRYKVFCQELHYKLMDDDKSHLEHDAYDDYSLHLYIEHARTGLIAGCLRLVMPLNDNNSSKHIPLEAYMKSVDYTSSLNPENIAREKICEISRLAISPIFRKKNSDAGNKDYKFFTIKEKNTFSFITIGLLLSTYVLVGLTNRQHVYAFMEPYLPRLISRFDLNFQEISKPISINGNRKVYYFDQEEAEVELKNSLHTLKVPYEYIWQKLVSQVDIALNKQSLLIGARPQLPIFDLAVI